MPSGASKRRIWGVSQCQKFRLLSNHITTSSSPLRLLFSGTVVHVSSLESEWKNLIYHSSSDFTSKISRFFVYFHTVDFQGPSRNLDLTLIFSPKMIFCPIFWYFLGVLESTTTSQFDSTNGQPEVLLRLPESQKILFFSQAEKC